MFFVEIPFELKEHIFTYFTPNDWINTAKFSNEWTDLTLRSIKKIESCHLLILDHLADFLNQQRNSNYTWISLLTLMPRLEHLECIESTETFWTEVSPVCNKLKILDFKPIHAARFNWTSLDITFDNLSELLWNGNHEGLLRILGMAPKLETIKLTYVQINAEWKKRIPESVKHIFLNNVDFTNDHQCSLDNLCQDTAALKTFSAYNCAFSMSAASKFFDKTPRLKKLDLILKRSDESTSIIVENALRNCQDLETVKASSLIITESWRRVIPENVTSINFIEMNVQRNIRHNFSLDSLFHNYVGLHSLELSCVNWTGFDPQKFYSTENLKRLYLYDNHIPEDDEPVGPFSDICLCMIRGSYLVDVELFCLEIEMSWRHIFPSTIKSLKLKRFRLSIAALEVFSPQFICENPSNIQTLILDKIGCDLPAMDLNAFTGMQMLQELNLNFHIPGECLQSILTNCSALTGLCIRGLTAGALTNIPLNLVLPSLIKLKVKKAVDEPYLLLQHFPKVRTVEIAILPSQASLSTMMNVLQVAETVEIKIRRLSWIHLRCLVLSSDDTQYKYFCLSSVSWINEKLGFYWTNSILDICHKLNNSNIFGIKGEVLWINNFPTSSLLRSASEILSNIDHLSQQYHEIMARNRMKPWQDDKELAIADLFLDDTFEENDE